MENNNVIKLDLLTLAEQTKSQTRSPLDIAKLYAEKLLDEIKEMLINYLAKIEDKLEQGQEEFIKKEDVLEIIRLINYYLQDFHATCLNILRALSQARRSLDLANYLTEKLRVDIMGLINGYLAEIIKKLEEDNQELVKKEEALEITRVFIYHGLDFNRGAQNILSELG